MSTAPTSPPRTPPAWFVRAAWRVHRGLVRLTRDRFLWTPENRRGWGAMHLTTIGRRSGQQRSVIVGYLEDGDDLVTLAMNGWQEGAPAWWLNLQAHPDAEVRVTGQPPRPVRAHAAEGEERERLWQRWLAVDPGLEGYAAGRTTDTPVVVLAPGEVFGPARARTETPVAARVDSTTINGGDAQSLSEWWKAVRDPRRPDGSGWVVLEDPAGNPFGIVGRDVERAAGP